MPRKDQGWITFRLPEEERQILESYCEKAHRSKTDVLRELVRTLNQSAQQINDSQRHLPDNQIMRISARNVFAAVVQEVKMGSVSAEVTLEITQSIEVVSVITSSSAEVMRLVKGKQAYVVIKSSDVIVAVND